MNNDFIQERQHMVQEDMIARGVQDPALLTVLKAVPREVFVPIENRAFSYADHPLDIGYGQTISQPFIVAYMLEALKVKRGDRVLEIGMGSGYQTALLQSLTAQVYTVERLPLLACRAMHTLYSLSMMVNVKIGDGTQGWKECAPFDKIIVSAASPGINQILFEQLKEGGLMVLPVGGILAQELVRVTKLPSGEKHVEHLCGCSFVPLIGKHGFRE